MSVRTKLAKAFRLVSERSVGFLGVIPRVPYFHYWTLRDGVESLVCLHNFFSILDPQARQPCRAIVRVYDPVGCELTTASVAIKAMGGRMLGVRGILGALADGHRVASEGSLEVDMVPPPDFNPAGGANAMQPSSARFYMIYRSPRGMLTTVHSIDRGTTYRGVPAPIGKVLGLHTRAPAKSWRSKRAIAASHLREVRVVAINHGGGSRTIHLGLRRGRDGGVVAQVEKAVPPRGLLALEYAPTSVGRAGEAPDDYYVVFSQSLATPNGKPYVWVGYGQGPMTMHHG